MLLQKTILTLAAASSAIASPISLTKRQSATRGVNLGGWLVLEPWITPSIFQAHGGSVVDEYTLCQQDPNAEGVLRAHWDSWVTLGDFQRIANSGKGINTVRIPIGYWAFEKYGQDPYVQGAKDYLHSALDWAGQTGLKVWIDLHGAPLSQNGFDNSGQKMGSPQFTAGDSIPFMSSVLGQVSAEFGSNPNVAGIQLLNEPLMSSLPAGRDGIEGFYNSAHGAVKGSSNAQVVIHDGFAEPSSWNGKLTDTIVDHHAYQVFSNDYAKMSYDEHVGAAYSDAAGFGGGRDRTLIVGEWTAAMTDCAPALNGYGIGARYDGTYSKGSDVSSYVGSCANKNFIDQWDQGLKDATRNYIQAQINAYESSANGWIFWNFKTEASAEWDFFRLIDNGVWP